MHEGSITQSILDSVLDTLKEENVSGKVREIHVTVGVTQGLVPESMQMFFDMQKPGTPLEDAELVVEAQGVEAWCPACEKQHTLDIPVMYCPDCGSPMEMRKGDEIIITSIEVDEYDETVDE